MKKRIFAMLLSSALLVSALAACGNDAGSSSSSQADSSRSSDSSSSQAEDPSSSETGGDESASGEVIEIEFFQQQGEEAIQAGYNAIIEDFQKEYPNIKITQNTVPDSLKVLASRIATDDVPPLLTDWPTQSQFKEKVRNGYYMDLTGQEFFSRVNESYLAMAPADDGKHYAMPYARNYMTVFYNIQMFKDNNIEIPETYADFINVCKTFKEKGIAPLYLPLKDGVGHIFQATTVAWTPQGVEDMVEVANGNGSLVGNADFENYANKMLELLEYGNEDAFGMSGTMMQEAFANGQCAMIIAGSYARGNIILANGDFKFGAFPLPGDTKETTKALTGVNAAQCISASASDAEKDAGLKFLEYISRTEVAQKWSDLSGEPSIINGTVYNDENCMPMLDFIDETGQVHDWMASTLNSNVVNELYNTVQAFLLDKQPVDEFLKNMDTTIETAMQ